MTGPRYASITSNLLVRKGEAKPWQLAGAVIDDQTVQPRPVCLGNEPTAADFEHWKRETRPAPRVEVDTLHAELPASSPAPQAREIVADHGKRCSIKLSHAEYERLGILAVKKEVSRQQVLHQAIDQYLAAAQREYEANCGCIARGCDGVCGDR